MDNWIFGTNVVEGNKGVQQQVASCVSSVETLSFTNTTNDEFEPTWVLDIITLVDGSASIVIRETLAVHVLPAMQLVALQEYA
jgi:hypothetical protein